MLTEQSNIQKKTMKTKPTKKRDYFYEAIIQDELENYKLKDISKMKKTMKTDEENYYIDEELDLELGLDDLDVTTEEDRLFADELRNFLINIVNDNKHDLNEEFKNNDDCKKHFEEHCLENTNRKSTRQTVYYDFKTNSQYKEYEKIISNKLKNYDYEICSLEDKEHIEKTLTKLFVGGKSVLFKATCDLKNKKGSFLLGVYAYSSNVTTNYSSQNTVDIIVFIPKTFKTITLFPVDANYFKNKINNIIHKYSNR